MSLLQPAMQNLQEGELHPEMHQAAAPLPVSGVRGVQGWALCLAHWEWWHWVGRLQADGTEMPLPPCAQSQCCNGSSCSH